MTLRQIVEQLLKDSPKSMADLATEMDRTYDGFKLSLNKESIKYSDLKKLATILNVPIELLFVSGTTNIQSQKGGSYNTMAHSSTLHEPATEYIRKELDGLKKQVTLLESQIVDKDRIIELLSRK